MLWYNYSTYTVFFGKVDANEENYSDTSSLSSAVHGQCNGAGCDGHDL